MDYFADKNPDWHSIGVRISSVPASGEASLTIRSSSQTRKALADALLSKVRLS